MQLDLIVVTNNGRTQDHQYILLFQLLNFNNQTSRWKQKQKQLYIHAHRYVQRSATISQRNFERFGMYQKNLFFLQRNLYFGINQMCEWRCYWELFSVSFLLSWSTRGHFILRNRVSMLFHSHISYNSMWDVRFETGCMRDYLHAAQKNWLKF